MLQIIRKSLHCGMSADTGNRLGYHYHPQQGNDYVKYIVILYSIFIVHQLHEQERHNNQQA